MTPRPPSSALARAKHGGFTLVEMAIGLLIVGLLFGSTLAGMAVQRDASRQRDTQAALQRAHEALLGFAATHGRLPCPDNDSNPTAAGHGLEDCPAQALPDNLLPWKTLGLPHGQDAWLRPLRYRVEPAFANPLQTISLHNTPLLERLSIRDASGAQLTSVHEPPVLVVWSTGMNLRADGANQVHQGPGAVYQAGAMTSQFDDQMLWLSRPILFNRLITAGRAQ